MIAKLSILGLLVSFTYALINTVWAIYMQGFIPSSAMIGLFSAFLTLIAFISYFLFIPLIEKSDKSRLYQLTLLLIAITFLLFSINRRFYFFILLAFVITVLQTLMVTSFGIMIKDKSKMKELSRNEGLRFTFANIAWVIGPLIAGVLSEKYGVNIIFSLSALFMMISFLLFRMFRINDHNVKKRIHKHPIKNFIAFFKNKDRFLAYVLGSGVTLWWSFFYLFMPLYIIQQDFGISVVGYFLFAVALPLISLEYYFGKIAGRIGFRKIFRLGYFIPFILAVSCFFITDLFIILSILALSSVGLAMLESTTEAYFFHTIKDKEETRFYGPYNTALDTGLFIGKFSASLVLFFLPFKFLFLLFGLFMFIMFLLSFYIKDFIEDGIKK